jgi:hypothetical protein
MMESVKGYMQRDIVFDEHFERAGICKLCRVNISIIFNSDFLAPSPLYLKLGVRTSWICFTALQLAMGITTHFFP